MKIRLSERWLLRKQRLKLKMTDFRDIAPAWTLLIVLMMDAVNVYFYGAIRHYIPEACHTHVLGNHNVITFHLTQNDLTNIINKTLNTITIRY
jgi:hypothetical protein